MAQIIIKNLTFAYEGNSENVFENVNLSFDTDWKIGLIGRNGRGKTTLLNLLLNKFEFQGKIISSSNFNYFPFEIENKNKPAIELIYDINQNIEIWEVMKKFKDLQLEESCLYQSFDTLSNGQQTKLLLAILFSIENNFLLIDEPTNHLDYNSRDCVKKFLNKQKGFIVVSHDRDFIDECVDHIISINKKDIEIQKGNFTTWWANKQNQDNLELLKNQQSRKEISRLQESSREKMLWSDKVEKTKNVKVAGLKPDKGAIGHKAAKMAKRGKVIENRQNKAIEDKQKLLKNIEKQDELFLNSQNLKEDTIVSIKDLSIYYDNKEIANGINFNVECGDKVAICGKNGCGKSSLLKLICGQAIKYKGILNISKKIKISYISQRYDWLKGNLFDFARENNIDQTKFLTMLYKLGFKREQFDIEIDNFSAGQKKKVLIAKSLCEEANLYVWDEPLNYIDVITRIQIEQLLKNSQITLIFVEHDSAFVKNLSNKIINL